MVAEPEAALDDLLAESEGLDRDEQRAQLDALTEAEAFSPPGELDRDALAAWARGDTDHGILEERPKVDEAFDLET